MFNMPGVKRGKPTQEVTLFKKASLLLGVPSQPVIPPLDPHIFPAKLLLFGEHVLLLGATALALPVSAFGGQWAWSDQRDRHHDRLLQFADSEALKGLGNIDVDQFKHDLKAGLYFQSNIPTGYGLGSSGALCAAIYDRYAYEKTGDLVELKSIFARMESFFHGNSSGIDPLTSFLGEPILIEDKTSVKRAALTKWPTEKPTVFLIDSNMPRQTAPLVTWFLEKSREAAFAEKLSAEYLPAHEALVQAWLLADTEQFWVNLRRISAFQLEHFCPMIPQTLQMFWKESFLRNDYVLKICGAGGGGFVLGFALNDSKAQTLAAQIPIVFP